MGAHLLVVVAVLQVPLGIVLDGILHVPVQVVDQRLGGKRKSRQEESKMTRVHSTSWLAGRVKFGRPRVREVGSMHDDMKLLLGRRASQRAGSFVNQKLVGEGCIAQRRAAHLVCRRLALEPHWQVRPEHPALQRLHLAVGLAGIGGEVG